MFSSNSIQYLIDFDATLKALEKYKRPLSEAARADDLLAEVIVHRAKRIMSGDYRKSEIETLNAEVRAWVKTNVTVLIDTPARSDETIRF